jgi:hypothetical protein
MPESQKQKMREKVVSEETRSKMSIAAQGRPKAMRSAEYRLKISQHVKESWNNPETRSKRIAAMHAAKHPKEP